MKAKEHAELCEELRLAHLKPGFDLTRLFVDAQKTLPELIQFVKAITEGYIRLCADNKILRDILEKADKRNDDGRNQAV